VDFDEKKEGPPPRLLTHGRRLYVTSLDKERWSRMGKAVRDIPRQYESAIGLEISNLTCKSLDKIFYHSSTFEMDKLSHKICVISHDTLENVASLQIVEPITPFIRSKLVCQLRTLERAERREQVSLYKRFATTPDCTALASIAFEATGQAMLQDGMDLVLVAMVHLPTNQEDSRPQ
jgi:hypothetical protein